MDIVAADRLLDFVQAMERVHFAPIAAQALAPAFLLSACAAMLSFLMNRLWRILDHFRALDPDRSTPGRKLEASRLLRRARLIYRAIHATIGSALAVAAVVLLVFIDSFLGMAREWGATLVFLLALGLMAHAFVCLLREVRIAMLEFGDLANADGATDKALE